MEFLIQISMFHHWCQRLSMPCFIWKCVSPRSIPLHAQKMSKIQGTLFLVKIKQGKTQHEHNEKFKRIAAWAKPAQLTVQAG